MTSRVVRVTAPSRPPHSPPQSPARQRPFRGNMREATAQRTHTHTHSYRLSTNTHVYGTLIISNKALRLSYDGPRRDLARAPSHTHCTSTTRPLRSKCGLDRIGIELGGKTMLPARIRGDADTSRRDHEPAYVKMFRKDTHRFQIYLPCIVCDGRKLPEVYSASCVARKRPFTGYNQLRRKLPNAFDR